MLFITHNSIVVINKIVHNFVDNYVYNFLDFNYNDVKTMTTHI